MKYKSFYGSATIKEATKLVGIDHALHATTVDNWQNCIQAHVIRSWSNNDAEKHMGWCAIMQAGRELTMNALYGR